MIGLDLDDLNRSLSPLRWALVGIAVVSLIVAVCLVGRGLGFRWDPFNSAGRKVAASQATAAVAVADGAARAVEAAGATDTTARVEVVLRQAARADQVVANLSPAAKAALDAEAPLDPDRVARLRGVDEQLCVIAPRVCAADRASEAAPPRHAGDGRGALSAAAPAG